MALLDLFLFLVAGMVTLQNMQNLANIQNTPHAASCAASLQGITSELPSSQIINAPLNLSVTSPGNKIFSCYLIRVARDETRSRFMKISSRSRK